MQTLRTLIAMAHKPTAPPVTPIALVNFTTGTGDANTVTASGIDTTGASLLVLFVRSYYGTNPTEPTISDNKGNTWTGLTASLRAGNTLRIRIFYCTSPIVGTGHTFTAAATGTSPNIQVHAFSNAGVYDGTELQANGGSSSSVALGPITPSQNNCLVVGALSTTNNIALGASASNGFTKPAHLSALMAAYKVQSASGAETTTFSTTTSGNWASTMAVFRHI